MALSFPTQDAGGKPLTKDQIMAVENMEASKYDPVSTFTFNTTKYATDLRKVHALLNMVGDCM